MNHQPLSKLCVKVLSSLKKLLGFSYLVGCTYVLYLTIQITSLYYPLVRAVQPNIVLSTNYGCYFFIAIISLSYITVQQTFINIANFMLPKFHVSNFHHLTHLYWILLLRWFESIHYFDRLVCTRVL